MSRAAAIAAGVLAAAILSAVWFGIGWLARGPGGPLAMPAGVRAALIAGRPCWLESDPDGRGGFRADWYCR